MRSADAPIQSLAVAAYIVPTETPESDGTLEWTSTTLVTVEVTAAGQTGFGYTYAGLEAATLISQVLAPELEGRDAMAIPAAWQAMIAAVRNLGHRGVAATAISAVDAALWDLKGRLLDLPLVRLIGAARPDVPVYGSGGFTSYDVPRLQRQLAGWAAEGFPSVKMKVGRAPAEDDRRVRAAREALGPSVELMVDANGAYDRKQALRFAELFAGYGVTWFEEPVSSDDLEGLRLLRDRGPAGMAITAGEYAYDLYDFRRLIEAGAVDVLQADATRCCGITGFLRAGALCAAHALPLSAHTAPSLHVAPCCALPGVRHIEYFFDHGRIEELLFDGAPRPKGGVLRPDVSRPGLGVMLKRQDAARFAA
ncbi:MAG: mandelate racemase [Chloroflexota bacterium]|nr:mandelate racemase [Chloroflexota bacterium]